MTRLSVLMVLLPSCNVTPPVGVPGPEAADTVIVKIMLWPKTLGFAEETNVAVVALLPTICVSVEELALKLLSPA